jgi:intracellular sulfur oxidation DsrE/DsrF family protein
MLACFPVLRSGVTWRFQREALTTMDKSRFKPTREAFLAGTAVLAAAPAMAQGVSKIPAIESVLHKPARHKQVIAAVKLDHGAPLRHAMNGLNAFEYAFGQGPGALHVAVVFYGSSLLIAANDAMWEKYHLFDILDASNDGLPDLIHTPQNPWLRPMAHADDDFSIQTLSRRGVTFIVCNNALHAMSRFIAAKQSLSDGQVYADLSHNLVPGAIIVPAGVAAIVLAQEAGFTFLYG